MRVYIDCPSGLAPKRGDIMQTNVGNRRERTCLILGVRCMRRSSRHSLQRYNVWAERWWQMEPILRWRLYLSAERNGGQQIIHFQRYSVKPTKKRILARTFLP
jgi:hypothetical protein